MRGIGSLGSGLQSCKVTQLSNIASLTPDFLREFLELAQKLKYVKFRLPLDFLRTPHPHTVDEVYGVYDLFFSFPVLPRGGGDAGNLCKLLIGNRLQLCTP